MLNELYTDNYGLVYFLKVPKYNKMRQWAITSLEQEEINLEEAINLLKSVK